MISLLCIVSRDGVVVVDILGAIACVLILSVHGILTRGVKFRFRGLRKPQNDKWCVTFADACSLDVRSSREKRARLSMALLEMTTNVDMSSGEREEVRVISCR